MSKESWQEISLITDGELAESVAEVLSRYIPDGIVIESTAVDITDEYSPGKPIGPLRVYGYIKVNDHLEETRQQIEQALWYLGRIRPLPAPEYRLIQQTDWSESWKQHYHPIAIGKSLMVVPAWLDVSTQARIPILIDPGMAFGTGTHPTTQLCLELIELIFQGDTKICVSKTEIGKINVIDVGCGSGILSIAALKLGAKRALGVDIDPQAIQSAIENANANGVDTNAVFEVGSLAEIKTGKFFLQRAQIILTNILAVVIIRLLDEGLTDLMTVEGNLILSGILEEQRGAVEEALERNGLQVVSQRQQGDWVALLVKHKN